MSDFLIPNSSTKSVVKPFIFCYCCCSISSGTTNIFTIYFECFKNLFNFVNNMLPRCCFLHWSHLQKLFNNFKIICNTSNKNWKLGWITYIGAFIQSKVVKFTLTCFHFKYIFSILRKILNPSCDCGVRKTCIFKWILLCPFIHKHLYTIFDKFAIAKRSETFCNRFFYFETFHIWCISTCPYKFTLLSFYLLL